jgi:hypothetical protein
MNQAKATGPLGNIQNQKTIQSTKKHAKVTIAGIFGPSNNLFPSEHKQQTIINKYAKSNRSSQPIRSRHNLNGSSGC